MDTNNGGLLTRRGKLAHTRGMVNPGSGGGSLSSPKTGAPPPAASMVFGASNMVFGANDMQWGS